MITAQRQPMNVRAVYETAYRNARCARSISPNSTIIPIVTTNETDRRKVTGIISWAIENAENRRQPMMGWFSLYYERKFKTRKSELSNAQSNS